MFYTPNGKQSRYFAAQQLLDYDYIGPDKLHRLEGDIGRRIPSALRNTMSTELVRVYSPIGKGSMMGGGVGCVRLQPRSTGQGDVWLMSASSTRIAHEGFPVVVPDELYASCVEVIAGAGGLRRDLSGRLRFISPEFDPLFSRVVGVPRVF